jgi:hypothetical protein
MGVVLAHPHPLYGGSMRTGVPAVLFERLPAMGIAALRFNFRGVEGSTGTHDRGGAERLDVRAAVGGMPAGLPVVLCGWSFGADVSLCVEDPRVAGWCCVAPPLAIVPVEEMAAAADTRPKHLLIPEHDQYDPPERAGDLTAGWAATTLTVIPGADHFVAGSMGFIADSVAAFAAGLVQG